MKHDEIGRAAGRACSCRCRHTRVQQRDRLAQAAKVCIKRALVRGRSVVGGLGGLYASEQGHKEVCMHRSKDSVATGHSWEQDQLGKEACIAASALARMDACL